MPMRDIEFYFDFGSPNAYFVHKVLPGLAERAGARALWKPVLLGGSFKATGNQSPMMAFGQVKGKLAYEQREIERFVKKHLLSEYQFNPHFPVNSLLMMRGAIFAEREGMLSAYVDACFSAMWETGQAMADPDVVRQVLDGAGLNGAAILEWAQEPAVKEALKERTEEAVARGLFGVPTIFVGDEMFFGKERLGQIEDHLLAAKSG